MHIDDSEHLADHLTTPYMKRQAALTAQIEAIENEISGPKSWGMKGEVQSHQREADSLMFEDVQFQHALRVEEPLTAELAMEIEDIIKQRIKDHHFDDVQPRHDKNDLGDITVTKKSDEEVLSSEKPRFGLAEQYEREFKQIATGISDHQVKLQEKYRELSGLFATVNSQLDALCNFYYTAKNNVTELKVTSSQVSAESKEEILPVSDLATAQGTAGLAASRLTSTTSAAPQEIHTADSATGMAVSGQEMSRDEKASSLRRRKEQKKKYVATKEQQLQDKAQSGHAGAQRKLEQDKLSKEYKKLSQSGKITVAGTSNAPQNKLTSMSGVVNTIQYNNQQQAAQEKHKQRHKKQQEQGHYTNAKNIMQ